MVRGSQILPGNDIHRLRQTLFGSLNLVIFGSQRHWDFHIQSSNLDTMGDFWDNELGFKDLISVKQSMNLQRIF